MARRHTRTRALAPKVAVLAHHDVFPPFYCNNRAQLTRRCASFGAQQLEPQLESCGKT